MTRRPHKIDAVLVVDTHYLPALFQLLDQAQERVDVLAYSFSIGSPKKFATSSPYAIAQKLVEVRKRGVEVRVYLEDRRETAARNRPTAKLLEAGGVDVEYGSTHAKGLCVDERWTLFGSTNFTQQSLTKNIETNLFFADERVAAGFEQYFEHLWQGGHHGGVVVEPPCVADGGFLPQLLEMIDGAQERIDFCIYFFHLAPVQDALIRAHRRGVAVRGLIHNHESFAMSYVRRTRGTVSRLRAAGLSDLHYGPTSLFTHAKFLVRDRAEIFLSTANWLPEDVDIHPQLSVRFRNDTTAAQLVDYLDKTIAARSTLATT